MSEKPITGASGGSLPGNKEQGDEKEGDDNHTDGSAGNEEGEKIC